MSPWLPILEERIRQRSGGGRPGVGSLDPTLLPDAGQTKKLELMAGGLGNPWPLLYGRHVIGGIPISQQEDSDKTLRLMLAGGLGEWDALETLWINGTSRTISDTNLVHFHPGLDGELGKESSPGTRNQKICQFFPTSFTPQLTFSQLCYLALKIPPDPAAPSATPSVLWIAKTRRVRVFDSSGAQTAYQYSASPADVIADSYIQFVVKPHSKINEALTTAEKARIDWSGYDDLRSTCAADPGDGKALFEAHVALLSVSDFKRWLALLELSGRAWCYERNGKLVMRPDKPRSSVMTVSRDLLAGPVELMPRALDQSVNRLRLKSRILDSGGADPAKDFQEDAKKFEDEAHQERTGRILDLTIDLQNTTRGRRQRLGEYLRARQMRVPQMAQARLLEADAGQAMNALEPEPGDRVVAAKDVEGWETRDWAVMEISDNPDFSRDVLVDEYDESMYSSALAGEGVVAAGVTPGTGLAPITNISGLPDTAEISPFAYDSGGTLSNRMWVRWRWKTTAGSDWKLYIPGDPPYEVTVPGSAGLAIPSAPTLSSVAGGALASRARYVRVALCKGGMMFGVSNESNITVPANELLKVSGTLANLGLTAAQAAGYGGWIPIVGASANNEQHGHGGTTPLPSSPVAFGTDWTEAAAGVDLIGHTRWVDDAVQAAARVWDLPASTTRYFYPDLDIQNNRVYFEGAALTALDPILAARCNRSGFRALGQSVNASIPAAGGTGSGSGGGGLGEPPGTQ